MTEVPAFLLGLLAGGVLGGVFFGGLWWTIGRGVRAAAPAAWFLSSFVLRTAIVGGGFYLVANGDWHRFLGCLAGFWLSRSAVTRWTRAGT